MRLRVVQAASPGSLKLWAAEPGVPCFCATHPLIHSISSPWASTLEHGTGSGSSRETQTQSPGAGSLPLPPRLTCLRPHLDILPGRIHLPRYPRYLVTPQEAKGNFCSCWWRNYVLYQSFFLQRGSEALQPWWRRVFFRSFRCHDGLAHSQEGREALLFRLHNSLLVGKGIINPSWRKETTLPLLFHSNLISWHEFLTWVAFLPRLVAPGRGWLFKTAGSRARHITRW